MSEERFKTIEETIKDLSSKVAHLDKSFVEINVSLKDYVGWTKQLEQTIRNLDDTVRDMSASHQQIPYERIRAIQERIDPVHEILRLHEKTYITRRDANVLTALSAFFISGFILILGLFGDYVLTDMKEDILYAGQTNKNLIIKNSKAIDTHNSSKAEVLRKIDSYHKGLN